MSRFHTFRRPCRILAPRFAAFLGFVVLAYAYAAAVLGALHGWPMLTPQAIPTLALFFLPSVVFAVAGAAMFARGITQAMQWEGSAGRLWQHVCKA